MDALKFVYLKTVIPIGYLNEVAENFIFTYNVPAIILIRKRELLNELTIFKEIQT